jgi:hypothetical protein
MRRRFALGFLVSIICISNVIGADTGYSDPVQSPEVAFRLFRTTNFYTFLKLSTRDGRIWQVQYDVQGDNRFTVDLNPFPLVDATQSKDGQFTLYPTANMYNFILIDQASGNTWQVQWSQDAKNRGIVPIPGPK